MYLIKTKSGKPYVAHDHADINLLIQNLAPAGEWDTIKKIILKTPMKDKDHLFIRLPTSTKKLFQARAEELGFTSAATYLKYLMAIDKEMRFLGHPRDFGPKKQVYYATLADTPSTRDPNKIKEVIPNLKDTDTEI